jgi:hypothetical protein
VPLPKQTCLATIDDPASRDRPPSHARPAVNHRHLTIDHPAMYLDPGAQPRLSSAPIRVPPQLSIANVSGTAFWFLLAKMGPLVRPRLIALFPTAENPDPHLAQLAYRSLRPGQPAKHLLTYP